MVTAASTPLIRDTVLRMDSDAGRLRCPEQFEVLNFANSQYTCIMIEERR